MATLLEHVAASRRHRDYAEHLFRHALTAARVGGYSWGELARVAGLSKNGVKYLVTEHQKGQGKP